MNIINLQQLKAIHTLLSKLNINSETKRSMVLGFTSGRAESTKELRSEEAAEMISHLKLLDPEEAGAEKMRAKIISMAHRIGWRVRGTTKVDMVSLDAWCLKYSSLKKKLNHHLYKELPALVTQFENGPYKSYISKV